jgi:hypothetical protein
MTPSGRAGAASCSYGPQPRGGRDSGAVATVAGHPHAPRRAIGRPNPSRHVWGGSRQFTHTHRLLLVCSTPKVRFILTGRSHIGSSCPRVITTPERVKRGTQAETRAPARGGNTQGEQADKYRVLVVAPDQRVRTHTAAETFRWKAATPKADPRQQQDWFLKCLQGKRASHLAA